ncbi:MAG: DUF6754 domain-containing protein [Candidatus Zixiibacteriota bacterium]
MKRIRLDLVGLLFLVSLLTCAYSVALGQPSENSAPIQSTIDTARVPAPAPATSLIATDHKYDDGNGIDLTWVPSTDDRLIDGKVIGYDLYRIEAGGETRRVAELEAGANSHSDGDVREGKSYQYYIVAKGKTDSSISVTTASIVPESEWINWNRGYLFLILMIVSVSVVYFIETARRGKKLFIRKIAGLDAVDDAIGRATEMGRPILFIPGIQDMNDVQTIAGVTILGHVSRTIAQYDTKLFMPVSRSLVMTAARETIKTSYMAAGRPDAYSDDMVPYITDEQFGYVAAVDGYMVRQKPATCFYLGAFFAESLIMAETGNSIGAIQIAGTAMPTQLPFFVAACDFTLIGEELFAASAYLSNEPKQLGALKGQDVGKAIAIIVILIGAAAATLGTAWHIESMNRLLAFLTNIFQTN